MGEGLTAQAKRDRLKVYEAMIAGWEFARHQTEEHKADELAKDIRDLRAHMALMAPVTPRERPTKQRTGTLLL